MAALEGIHPMTKVTGFLPIIFSKLSNAILNIYKAIEKCIKALRTPSTTLTPLFYTIKIAVDDAG
ncbi:hypothetical protein BBP13_11610 [Limosilactobacillus reuteri]|nr:hypothetical protein BBP13_11610 [Limosilactobacillus reuteri]